MSIGKPEGEKMVAAMSARRLMLAFPALLCAVAGWLSLGSPPALACPNEQLRAGPSSSLPDCRAYEMVSPVDKNGFYVTEGIEGVGQASFDGNGVVYKATGGFPGSVSGSLVDYYRASRGEGGWSTEALLPSQAYSYTADHGYTFPMFAAYSPDLSKGVLIDATDSPLLVSGEQETGPNAANLFLRDNTSGAYSLLNFPAPGVEPSAYEPTFDGASADYTTIIFDAPAVLTPEAPSGGVDNLYEWTGGAIALVSQIPPTGASSCGPSGPACLPAAHGGKFGAENAHKTRQVARAASLVRVISADGSRIFFDVEGDLYVRENATTTVRLDAPQGGAGPGGGGVFATATGNGSQVFFFDEASAGLTANTQSGSGTNLYSYDTLTGTLTDLTPAAKAEVLGVVNEASEDGSYLYFVARDVLSTERNSLGEEALSGAENIYLANDGTISFIHTIKDHSGEVYSHAIGLRYHNGSRVTPDGRHLAFFAEDDGTDPEANHAVFAELFEYSADSGQVSRLCGCAGSEFSQPTSEGELDQVEGTFQYSRGLSDDGARIFFESYNPLVPHDSVGADVYEYEQDGAGSCTVAPGCLSLISTGTSEPGAWFVDASASGNDVFFTTDQQLVSSDADGAYDLYDARVNGGIPAPPQPPECLGDGCLNVPPAPIDATPSSLTFSGAGNLPSAQAARPAAKSRAPKKQSKPKRKRLGKKAKAKRAGKTSRKGTK
jgi:hypothetical protein